jgi:signal transduction histidine kinase/CheY-like chemotaxis protein/HPt (histidine-containing phosphotransfer) domain-containing protein/CHASE3 domain sensor protein
MTRKLTFRIKILIITFVILGLIGSLGFVAYYKFSGIVLKVSEATNTDRSIALAKEILSDLTIAENKVKSYTLTRDELYVYQFDSVAVDIEEKIVLLYSGVNKSIATNGDMDTLINLVSLKFDILSSLLTLQNEFRVQEAFGKIEERLNNEVEKESFVEAREKKKLSLFRKKEKEMLKEKDSPTEISKLKNDLKTVSKLESQKEQELITRELELIKADAVVTLTISSLLKHFEDEELKRIEERSEFVRTEVDTTKILIATVCVVTSLFLLIMIYTTVNYLRANNRYLRMIKKAKRDSEQLTRAKERFIATISHELRTPMNSIVGFTEQIAQGPLTRLQKAQIEIVRKASDHLLHLINEFLDFSRLQENKLTLSMTPFCPSSVIQEVVEISSSLANSKGISLHYEFSEQTEQVLVGDAFRLRQILLNVIGNAIKFTPEGGVEIKASLENIGDEKMLLKIQIIDTGIGIDKDKLNSIFDVFEQESNSTSSQFGGSGLGLSITKRLIDLHGGTIALASKKKVGTSVEINLPYTLGKYLELSESKALHLKLEDIKGLKVLVVDDEKYNRDLLKAILRKWLVEVTELEDGEQVSKHIQNNPTDLILMDVRMPLVSGIEATLEVRQLEHSAASVPIILLTAAVTEEDRMNYLNSGVDMVLAKPFIEAQLIEAIFYVLGKGEFIEEKKNVELNTEISFEALRQTCEDDHEFYTEMLSALHKSILDTQVSLRSALEQSDYKSIAELAHRICAPVKHIRAERLYSLFKKMENLCRSNANLDELPDLLNEINKEAVFVCQEIRKEISNV